MCVCVCEIVKHTYAGPEPAKPVTGSIKFSGTSSHKPTEENNFSAISASLSPAYFPRAYTVAPQPTRTGVLGITLITGVPSGKA